VFCFMGLWGWCQLATYLYMLRLCISLVGLGIGNGRHSVCKIWWDVCVLLDHGHTYACNVCNVLYIYLNLDT